MLRFSMRVCRRSSRAPAGARSASCPISPTPHRLPAEDVLGLADTAGNRMRKSGLRCRGCRVSPTSTTSIRSAPSPMSRCVIVESGQAIPGDCDLILIPGSKATIADLEALRQAGWDIDIAAHRRRGGRVLGLCGGYQMLGRTIADPEGIEGRRESFRAWASSRSIRCSPATRRPARSAACTRKAAPPSAATKSILAEAKGPTAHARS